MTVSIIGTGNVATALAHRFKACGVMVLQVYGRNIDTAKNVAQIADCEAINNIEKLLPYADCYLIAVSDRAIHDVAKSLREVLPETAFVAHTSGAVPAVIFENIFERYGCFYPLQSFTKGVQPDFPSIPICVWGHFTADVNFLSDLAKFIGSKVYHISDADKARIHVAAVMVNNFANHLFRLADDYLKVEGLDFDILKPLIQETARKIMDNSPMMVQTGPAKRGDLPTIEQHLALLEKHQNIQHIYQLLTQNIIYYENHREH